MNENTPLTRADLRSPNGSQERVHNVARAQVMAKAVKIYEDESSALRGITESIMTRPYYQSTDGLINFGDVASEVEHGEPSEVPASMAADRKEALETLSVLLTEHGTDRGISSMLPIDAIATQIQHNNKTSDNIADTVGDAYDKLEATKR